MPANSEAPNGEAEPRGAELHGAELQFALALRMLKAATDNMQVAFTSLLRARSGDPQDESLAPERGTVGQTPVRRVFGERARAAIEAAERLRDRETATGAADAAPSSSDQPSTESAHHGDQPA